MLRERPNHGPNDWLTRRQARELEAGRERAQALCKADTEGRKARQTLQYWERSPRFTLNRFESQHSMINGYTNNSFRGLWARDRIFPVYSSTKCDRRGWQDKKTSMHDTPTNHSSVLPSSPPPQSKAQHCESRSSNQRGGSRVKNHLAQATLLPHNIRRVEPIKRRIQLVNSSTHWTNHLVVIHCRVGALVLFPGCHSLSPAP